MKKIKKRIFEYTSQPIQKFWLTLGILLLLSGGIFVLLSFMAWQGWFFDSLAISWPYLAIISPCICYALFRNTQHIFKFPFWIQRHLIDPKLALDLKDLALRSSDAIILDHKQIKTPWWQAQRHALLLELKPHETPQWFQVNFGQIFNQHEFLNLNLKPTDKLIGQQVLVYYLARSHQIFQIYQLHPPDDLSTVDAYMNTAQIANIHFEKIPTRLILDLPKVTCVEVVRSNDHQGHLLKITTSYAQVYQISSQTPHFDKLELALARLVDFMRYRNFKHNPTLQQTVLTTRHPLFYRTVVYWILIVILFIGAVLLQNGVILLFGLLWIYLYINSIRSFNASPWIEESEFE
jgi:hypothetical protein